MVVGGRYEEQVDRLGNLESIARHPDRPQVRDRAVSGNAHEIVERGLARVERIDDTIRLHRPGEPQGEVTHARPQVPHDHPRPDVEGANDRVGVPQAILPGSTGVQPAADRSGQPVEDHGRTPADPSAARPAASTV